MKIQLARQWVPKMKRRFILLDAYERFTEKETLCLKESNFDEALRLQGKKSKIIRELADLDDAERLSEEKRQEFNRRLADLERIESENGQLLERMQSENRSQVRSLSKRVLAVSSIQKAYGSSGGKATTERGLEGKA